MTVPLRSGLAAAGRRLDRTIRAQGQGSTVCGDRTVCYTGAAKVRRSVALHRVTCIHIRRSGDATRRARRHRRSLIQLSAVRMKKKTVEKKQLCKTPIMQNADYGPARKGLQNLFKFGCTPRCGDKPESRECDSDQV